jgi:parallel beta-helix repeat protein
MQRKRTLAFVLVFVFSSMLTLSGRVQILEASGLTIYIRANGSIYPPAAPISNLNNSTYTLMDDINGSLVVERDNIIIDGGNYTLMGSGTGIGVDVTMRVNVTLQYIGFRGFSMAIHMSFSSDCYILNNTITDGGGIVLYYDSNNNTIVGNVLTNCSMGISMSECSKNRLRDNRLVNNFYAFGASGVTLDHNIHDIDISNTIDGKPIYYLINRSNLIISPDTFPDIGYLGIINSTNIVIGNLTILRQGLGLQVSYTEGSKIENVTVSDTDECIDLYGSANNTITGNNLTNCMFGLGLINSTQNNVTSNIISGAVVAAIALRNSTGNRITESLVSNCGRCLDLMDSSGNIIEHNNFVSYSEIYVQNSTNAWDNGVEGNYWAHYTGVDSNEDGIGDTFYSLDVNNSDRYPLMGMFHSFVVVPPYSGNETQFVSVISNSTVSGLGLYFWLSSPNQYLQPGQVYVMFFATGENGTAGFCRMTMPRSVLNSTQYVVLVDMKPVNVTELPIPLSSHVCMYFAYDHSSHEVIIPIKENPAVFVPLMIAVALAILVKKKAPGGWRLAR